MGNDSFGKRQREKKQQERAAEKRHRRADRAQRAQPEQPDSALLMERFRVLSEAFASGRIDRNSYETERRAIFSDLGLADAFDD